MHQAKEPNPPQQPSGLISPWRPWLAGAILVLLVAIVYLPTLGNGFFFGDSVDVEQNLALRSLEGLSNIWFKLGAVDAYYPLSYSSFWVEYHLWGLNPRGYHIVNLLLHALSAVLVWRLLLRLAVPGAWLAAAIFAVHPVEVESVAWVTERANVLSCALALGSLLAYLRFSPAEAAAPLAAASSAARGGRRYYALALGLFLAALLSKPVTITLPAVLLVIDWWKRGRLTWRDVARTAPFFVVGLAVIGTTFIRAMGLEASGQEWDLSLADRVLIAGRALWFYSGKLIWPHPLIFFYPRWEIDAHQWWQYVFPAAAVLVIAGLWLARTRIGRGPLAAVLIFAGVLVPVIGDFDANLFRFTIVADHLQYHASIALIALAAAAAAQIVGRLATQARWFAPVAGAVLLLPLAVVAQQRTHVCKDYMTVIEDTVAKAPQSWLVYHWLGLQLEQERKYDEAVLQFCKAIEIREQFARDDPRTVSEYKNDIAANIVSIGLSQRDMGPAAKAESSFRRAIAIHEKLVRENPTVGDYRNALGSDYIQLGVLQRATGGPAEAIASLLQAIEILEQLARESPSVDEYRNNLGWSYVNLAQARLDNGQVAEAEASHRTAIETREKLAQDNPAVNKYQDDAAASYSDLGRLQRDIGRPADAERSFRKAIKFRGNLTHDPSSESEYQDRLAWCYVDLAGAQQKIGRPAEAVVSHRRAIVIREMLARQNPAVSTYQNNVAASYVDAGILQYAIGRPAEAKSSFRKAIEVREKLVRDHPTASSYQDGLAWCYVDLAVAERNIGRPAEAEASYRKAIEIREKLAQDNPSVDDCKHQVAVSYRDLGSLQLATGQITEAVAVLRKAIEIHQKLAVDYPDNAACQSNLASDLVLCGDALALLGQWSDSADLYARAVVAGNYSWQTMGLLALVQRAAGNDAGYRTTCADLVKRHGDNTAPGPAISMAFALVVGDKALDNMDQALALAKRAAKADPSNPVAAIMVGAAQYRARRSKQAIATLTGALPQLDPATSAAAGKPDQILGRLIGEMILALAYRRQANSQALQTQLDTLRELIDTTETPGPQSSDGLPPWAVGFAVEIAKRELAKLSAPAHPSK